MDEADRFVQMPERYGGRGPEANENAAEERNPTVADVEKKPSAVMGFFLFLAAQAGNAAECRMLIAEKADINSQHTEVSPSVSFFGYSCFF